MASTPGAEPGPHWWKASALTTAPPLFPLQPFSGGAQEYSNVAGHTAELVVCASVLKLAEFETLAKKKKV